MREVTAALPKGSPDPGLRPRVGRARPAAVVLGLLALVAATAVAPAATAAAPAPPVARSGIVSISGSSTAYVTIRVPAGTELLQPEQYGATPFATGKGRYLGYVLSDNKPRGVRVVGGVHPGSTFGAYASALRGVPAGPTLRLPAGTYRLYLLADGSPVTVNLKFKARGGVTRLRPTIRVPYTLADPKVLVAPGGTPAVAGAEATLPSRGMSFDLLTEDHAVFLASNTQLCFYTTTPPPQPVGYGPGCTGGRPATLTFLAPGTSGGHGAAFSILADLPAGRYGQGFNRVGVSVTDSIRYTTAFLAFDAPRRGTSATRDATPSRDAAGAVGGTKDEAAQPATPVAAPAGLPATGLPETVPVAAVVALAAATRLLRARRCG